jgi:hypothetical protein
MKIELKKNVYNNGIYVDKRRKFILADFEDNVFRRSVNIF